MSGKTYSLIFWTTLKYSSVLKTENIVSSDKNGLMAKLRRKNYPLKIIMQHDDQEYLKKCVVDETGNLITEENDPKVDKTKSGKKGKGKTVKDKSAKPTVDAEIIKKPSIFENSKNGQNKDSSKPSTSTQEQVQNAEGQTGQSGGVVSLLDGDSSGQEDLPKKKKSNKRKILDDDDENDETGFEIEERLKKSRKSKKIDGNSDESREESLVDSSESSGYDKKKLFQEFLLYFEKQNGNEKQKTKREKKVSSKRPKEV